MLKLALKEWHASHTQNLPAKIDSLKAWLSILDGKGEEVSLSQVEIEEMQDITSNIHSLSRVSTSICWQQSRLQWLREGYANLKYFHSVLSSRQRQNALTLIVVNGSLVEGVHPIRSAVLTISQLIFKRTV